MKLLFSTLPRILIKCFAGRMFFWHLIAIALTLALVLSGFDWQYFLWTRSPMLQAWLFPAVPIGGLVPIALPLVLLMLFTAGNLLPQQVVIVPLYNKAEHIGECIASAVACRVSTRA